MGFLGGDNSRAKAPRSSPTTAILGRGTSNAMDWKIASTGKNCSLSGKEFKIGESYYSILVKMEGEYVRRNVSEECWERVNKDSGEIFSWWRTRVQEPDKPKNKGLDFQAIYSFFLRLMDLQEPEARDVQLRYLLSLLLLRKKFLKFSQSVRRDNGDYWVLKAADSEQEFVVLKPDLSALQFQELTEQLQSIFNLESCD
jgi:hypothetical protein